MRASKFLVLALTLLAPFAANAAGRVLLVSPEQTTVLQTGGLGSATTGLAKALKAQGYATEVLMPFYLQMKPQELVSTNEQYSVALDWRDGVPHKHSRFDVLKNNDPSDPTTFLRHDPLPGERNYFDNRVPEKAKLIYSPIDREGESFGAFCKAAADHILAQNYDESDIVILNDWTTGLIATHLAEAKAHGAKVPKVVFAIHNIAYKGLFPESLARYLGLDQKYYTVDGYEFYGQMSFMKAGLQWADKIYTVSNEYAKEIMTPRFGSGLDGVMRAKAAAGRVIGILNGILDDEWSPMKVWKGMDYTFSRSDLSGKAQGKSALQAEVGFRVRSDAPLFILTSRLDHQKGLEYLMDAVAQLSQESDAQFIFTGQGEQHWVDALHALQAKYPNHVRYYPFTHEMERKLTRYGDFFINGAWFEPSGLNQFYSMLNGTIPLVSDVGGLRESVKDHVTGLRFKITEGQNGEPYDRAATAQAVTSTLREAVALYRNKAALNRMRMAGMEQDNSWKSRVRREFHDLFGSLVEGFAPTEKPRLEEKPLEDAPARKAPRMTAPRCRALFAAAGVLAAYCVNSFDNCPPPTSLQFGAAPNATPAAAP